MYCAVVPGPVWPRTEPPLHSHSEFRGQKASHEQDAMSFLLQLVPGRNRARSLNVGRNAEERIASGALLRAGVLGLTRAVQASLQHPR